MGLSIVKYSLLVNDFLAGAAISHLPAVGEKTVAHPRGMVALAAKEHDVRRRNEGFSLDDAARSSLARRFGMALHHVDSLDDNAVLLGVGKAHLTLLPSILAGYDHDRIVFSDFHRVTSLSSYL